jgi:predicted PurR-regulated permease PerM
VQARVVEIRSRTLLRILAIVIGVTIVLTILWEARQVISWLIISLFLTLALNPLVSWIERRAHVGRGIAITLAYLLVAIAIAAVGWTFVPKLVSEVNGFVQHLPNYVHDLTHGRGRLGFLERKYHVVEKVREQVNKGGASRLLGLSGAALSITKSVLTIITATVTIVFLTFFMLLEGGRWVEGFYGFLPEGSRPRWRKVGHDIYRTVGGYVTGNLLISLIAGVSATLVLLVMGVPYAVALGLLVAILDLIPLAGATLAGIVVVGISFLHSLVAGVVVLVFIVVYQQVENHFLQPVIYGRTVQLSPLVVLMAVLIGADLAGILGALAAIPVAGSIQVVLRDLLAHRRRSTLGPEASPPPVPDPG